jgi:hypothetical protein
VEASKAQMQLTHSMARLDKFNPEASNLRSYVNRVADHLNRSDPNHPLRGYLEDCLHDLSHFRGKELQSRDKTPNTPGLRAQDLILSFVTISERLTQPVDQLSLGHVDFNTFLADLREKLFTSGDSMMSIWSVRYVFSKA